MRTRYRFVPYKEKSKEELAGGPKSYADAPLNAGAPDMRVAPGPPNKTYICKTVVTIVKKLIFLVHSAYFIEHTGSSTIPSVIIRSPAFPSGNRTSRQVGNLRFLQIVLVHIQVFLGKEHKHHPLDIRKPFQLLQCGRNGYFRRVAYRVSVRAGANGWKCYGGQSVLVGDFKTSAVATLQESRLP